MYFEKYGSGQNVYVGFHGWSGDHRTFLLLVPYLPKNVAFYSADLPGNGKSPSPSRWTMKELVADIVEGLHSLQEPQISILGSCSGGLLSLFVAKNLLETTQSININRLILIDPFAYFPWYFNVFVAPAIGKVGKYAYYTTFANPIGRWITNLSLRRHRDEAASLTNSFSKVNHQVTYQYLKLLAQGGEAKQFEDITIPVVIIYGVKTFNGIRRSVQMWKEILPHVDSFELPGAGHLPIEENPAGLAETLFQSR